MKLTVGQVWTSMAADKVSAVVKDCRNNNAVKVQILYDGQPASAKARYQTMSLVQLEAEFNLESDPRSKSHRPYAN